METLSNPLLSICIPTYNNSSYLKNTLNSIVNQEGFDQRCEIVISDNNSNDDTSQMVHNEFICKYNNVRYYSNEINIGADKNFIKAMNYAEGKYIKLHADNWCFIDHKLSDLLNYLDQSDHNVIFLLNKYFNSTNAGTIQCNDLNQFVSIVSFLCTWITGIIYKNSSYKNITEKERYLSRRLAQTDILLRLLMRSSALVINEKMMIAQVRESKGDYNIFEVFISNYLSLYQDYLQSGILSRETYNKEKINLLSNFIFPWYTMMFLIRDKRYHFDVSKAHRTILEHYWLEPRLYLYPIYLIKNVFNKLIGICGKESKEL